MSQYSDPKFLRLSQYVDATNLSARIQLHRLFSTNAQGWFSWILEQLCIPPQSRVLELGCGTGGLWLEDPGKLPQGWQVFLTDLSLGMAKQARVNTSALPQVKALAQVDACAIPFPAYCFDAVIANHMLYHVPDRPGALKEIRRILKPGGFLFASTVGECHLSEIDQLVRRFDQSINRDDLLSNPSDRSSLTSDWETWKVTFTLENGYAQLKPWFESLQLARYPDSLLVTAAGPLADYILSSMRSVLPRTVKEALSSFLDDEIAAAGGAMHITKDSGLFTARVLPRHTGGLMRY